MDEYEELASPEAVERAVREGRAVEICSPWDTELAEPEWQFPFAIDPVAWKRDGCRVRARRVQP